MGLEEEKLKLEKKKLGVEVYKWLIISIGTCVSFFILDMGKLSLEKTKSDNLILNSYLKSTETPDPYLWLRKLDLIKQFSSNKDIKNWASVEKDRVKNYSGKLILYKETLRVASVVANGALKNTEEWKKADKRFFELYYADLVFIGEGDKIKKAMIDFIKILNGVKSGVLDWNKLNSPLLGLSKALANETEELKDEY